MLDFNDIRRELKEDLRPRKVIRYALVPHFGGIMNPVKDVFALLVRTIALLFVQSNLLPKNHPAMTGDVRGIGAIWLMIVDASANLKFTKQNIPQIAVFYAIVGMIVFSVLGTLTFMLKLGVGSAHAQDTSGYFTDPTGSLASGWLDSLFPYKTGLTNQVPAIAGLAATVGNLLSIYNTGVLVLASFVALYSIITMILESAHHGEIGGKRHSELFAPLRLVIAIGLLVPVSNGYNSAQIIVIQLAHAGSGLANTVWQQFVTNLVPTSPTQALVGGPNLNMVLQNTIIDLTCYQGLATNPGQGTITVTSTVPNGGLTTSSKILTGSAFTAITIPMAGTSSASTYKLNFNYNDGDAYCGSVDLPVPDQTVISGHLSDYSTVYANDIYAPAILIANSLTGSASPSPTSGAYDSDTPNVTSFNWGTVINKANTDLDAAATGVITAYLGSDTSIKTITTTAQTQGWASAGGTFFGLANIASNLSKIQFRNFSVNIPDKTILPVQHGGDGKSQDDCPSRFNVISWFTGKPAYCSSQGVKTRDTISTAYDFSHAAQAASGITPNFDDAGTNNTSNKEGSLSTALRSSFNPIQIISSITNTTSTSYADPLFKAMYIGNVLAGADAALFTLVAILGGSIFGIGLSIVLTFFSGVLFPIAMILAVYLPLYPAMRFLFGIATWLLTIFEAMIALPIVAMYSIQSHGEGLWAHGQQGYLMVLQMILRPVLMIFGLLAAILVFDILFTFIGVTVSNTYATIGAGSTQGALSTLGSWMMGFGFVVVYAFLVYSVANMSFQMINTFPDRILAWIGVGAGISAGQNDLSSTVVGESMQPASMISQRAGRNMARPAQIGHAIYDHKEAQDAQNAVSSATNNPDRWSSDREKRTKANDHLNTVKALASQKEQDAQQSRQKLDKDVL